MTALLDRLGRLLVTMRTGNIAIAVSLLVMPLVLGTGFLTDRNGQPGRGIQARGGLEASLEAGGRSLPPRVSRARTEPLKPTPSPV